MNPSAAPERPVLGLVERRVLGVLVEKAKTTPDTYPLSLNALVTGCNQKSNRDPVLDLSDADIEEALLEAQKKGLVARVTGGRVERWRHLLYEAWQVNKVELAVLAELLLRGAQTEGELRGRASRMEPIDDLETLRDVLKSMASRGLVVYLTPEGRRGTTVTDGFQSPAELTRLRSVHGERADPEAPAAPRPAPPRPDLEAQLAECRAEIAALRAGLDDLRARFDSLARSLGA
jgi:uncharacterized protein YceH (UPF0502 family)